MTVLLDSGKLRQLVTLFNPGPPISDGDGGFLQTYATLDPPHWRCAVEKASVRASERAFGATVIAQASHILRGRFHPGITTETQVAWIDRVGVTHTASVLDVDDTEGAGVETVVLVSELLGVAPADLTIDGGTPDSVFTGAGFDGGGA